MGNIAAKRKPSAVCAFNSDKTETETHIFRHSTAIGKSLSAIGGGETVQSVLERRFRAADQRFLGRRQLDAATRRRAAEFSWLRNAEVERAADAFGAGTLALGLVAECLADGAAPRRALAFYSKNTIEGFVADIACALYGIVIVNIYDTLGREATAFALNQCRVPSCVVAPSQAESLAELKAAGEIPHLNNLILIDAATTNTAKLSAFRLFDFEEVIAEGNRRPQMRVVARPDSLYAFSYTSGTTGNPKGVMITHGNITSLLSGVQLELGAYLGPDKRYLSYLPMAHILERALFLIATSSGAAIGVFSGDVACINEDARSLRPTVFVSVPRVYARIREGVLKAVRERSFLTRMLFNYALRAKIANLSFGKVKHFVYDRLVFSRVRAELGGCIELLVSGSAPLDATVATFIAAVFGAPLVEGYGQTEGCGVMFLSSNPTAIGRGVGGPQPQNEFKLVDVPELNYFCTDRDAEGRPAPRGEVYVRGPNIARGYYLDDEKTAETFTADGWLKTGDIGVLLPPDSFLSLIDRRKDIFKLSQGEYIAPDKLESVYTAVCPFIADIFVYGDSKRDFLVAVVALSDAETLRFAKESGVFGESAAALRVSPDFKSALLTRFREKGKTRGLNGLEMIRSVLVIDRPFADFGLKTVTMKLKRHSAKAFFAKEIEAMYS